MLETKSFPLGKETLLALDCKDWGMPATGGASLCSGYYAQLMILLMPSRPLMLLLLLLFDVIDAGAVPVTHAAV